MLGVAAGRLRLGVRLPSPNKRHRVGRSTHDPDRGQAPFALPHRAGPDALRLHRIARAMVDPAWCAMLTDAAAVAAATTVLEPPAGTEEAR